MTSLRGDGQRDRSQDCDMLGHREGRSAARTRMTVERLHGVYGLDRQHHGAQPAHPAVAGHRAAPPLRLQGAAEPSPPLTEQCLTQPVLLSQ